jgi:hypothetical protein
MAIQVQPVMIELRWSRPVGAFDKMPCASRTETTVDATNMTRTIETGDDGVPHPAPLLRIRQEQQAVQERESRIPAP